jgi:DNA (cytosine-5)-methyltransferase 1
MTYGSLFSGIGGIDLGLTRADMQCAWQIEINRECHKELNRYWPEAPKFYDVRNFEQYDLQPVDLVAGGFPCQPHSVAGERRGEDDERNLWPDFFRVVQALRPRWVLAENVPGIRTTIADRVLADLEAEGYACWPFVVGAWAVGAPHRRDRVWFVAYDRRPRQYQSKRILGEEWRRPENGGNRTADALRSQRWPETRAADERHGADEGRQEASGFEFRGEQLADSRCRRPQVADNPGSMAGVIGWLSSERRSQATQSEGCGDLDNADGRLPETQSRQIEKAHRWIGDTGESRAFGVGMADTESARLEDYRNKFGDGAAFARSANLSDCSWPARHREHQHEWEEARTNLPYDLLGIWDRVRAHYPQTLRTTEEKREAEKAFGLPVGAMGRAVDGLSGKLLRRYIGQLKRNRIHALGGLGNAVVPDVVEAIGRAIIKADRELRGKT